MKTKILDINQVVLDKELYPRLNPDFVTQARYFHALQSGAVFPNIVVAYLDNVYYLVDGLHRLTAFKNCKRTHLQVDILENLTKKEIYLEAVKRNISHGKQFSTQDVVNVCITLKNWDMSQEEISEIVRIPTNKITPFVAKRMTRITETQEEIPLKSPLKHFAGLEVSNDFKQGKFSSSSQENILNSILFLLKNNYLELNDKIQKKLKELYTLLTPYQ